jgi:DHA1 family bicyclomycin/chloramphenicol resistance-like MFS transporter
MPQDPSHASHTTQPVAGGTGMGPLPGKRTWLIANLLGQIAFGLLAMTICLPSMQEWGAIFQADQAAVQLTFSAYVVAYGGLQLVYGPLSDRHGRKNVLLVGLVLAGIGSLLAALSPDLPSLTAARFLQGAGAAATMVVGRSMVQDLFQGAERTRVMAYIGMVLGMCPPLATVIGGQLHVRLGWQSNFVLMTSLAALMFLAAWRGLPARPPLRADGDSAQTHWLVAMGRAYARLAREPAFRLYVTILSLSTATFYAFLAGAPIVMRSYGVGPDGVGWYIMCVPMAYIVGNFLTSHWVRDKGERRVMQIGQAAAVTGLVLLLALGFAGLKTPLAFSLPLILLGLGHGLLVPPSISGTVGLIPALAGAAAAAAGLVQQLMGAFGGYAVGLMPHDGAVNLGLLMMGFTLCALAAQWMLHRR